MRRLDPAWALRSALLLVRIALRPSPLSVLSTKGTVFSLVAPCQAGASPLSVLTRGFTTGCAGC